MLSEQIEDACRALGVSLGSGVAYGATPALDITAERHAVPLADASVVSLSSGFITFCSHVSKAFSLSLPHEARDGVPVVSFDPKLVLARISSSEDIKRYWAKIIGAYAFGSGPLNVERILVPHPASITRAQLLFSMERFSLAHEYAHHIAKHGRRETIGVGERTDAINEEFEADLFALALERHIGYCDTPPNVCSAAGAAATLILKLLECVRRVRQIFLTGDDTLPPQRLHPAAADRIAAFDSLDGQVPERNRQDFRKMRRDFVIIVDEVYRRLRPTYVQMHKEGIRPLDTEHESWLPN
jgi:hypothetical protein